jgi:hypothetical protein
LIEAIRKEIPQEEFDYQTLRVVFDVFFYVLIAE